MGDRFEEQQEAVDDSKVRVPAEDGGVETRDAEGPQDAEAPVFPEPTGTDGPSAATGGTTPTAEDDTDK